MHCSASQPRAHAPSSSWSTAVGRLWPQKWLPHRAIVGSLAYTVPNRWMHLPPSSSTSVEMQARNICRRSGTIGRGLVTSRWPALATTDRSLHGTIRCLWVSMTFRWSRIARLSPFVRSDLQEVPRAEKEQDRRSAEEPGTHVLQSYLCRGRLTEEEPTHLDSVEHPHGGDGRVVKEDRRVARGADFSIGYVKSPGADGDQECSFEGLRLNDGRAKPRTNSADRRPMKPSGTCSHCVRSTRPSHAPGRRSTTSGQNSPSMPRGLRRAEQSHGRAPRRRARTDDPRGDPRGAPPQLTAARLDGEAMRGRC